MKSTLTSVFMDEANFGTRIFHSRAEHATALAELMASQKEEALRASLTGALQEILAGVMPVSQARKGAEALFAKRESLMAIITGKDSGVRTPKSPESAASSPRRERAAASKSAPAKEAPAKKAPEAPAGEVKRGRGRPRKDAGTPPPPAGAPVKK